MSLQHVAEALRASARDSDAKLLLVAMSFHANDQGLCCKSCDRLLRDTQLDAGTMAEAIDTLRNDGLLERHGTDRTNGMTVWRLRL